MTIFQRNLSLKNYDKIPLSSRYQQGFSMDCIKSPRRALCSARSRTTKSSPHKQQAFKTSRAPKPPKSSLQAQQNFEYLCAIKSCRMVMMDNACCNIKIYIGGPNKRVWNPKSGNARAMAGSAAKWADDETRSQTERRSGSCMSRLHLH